MLHNKQTIPKVIEIDRKVERVDEDETFIEASTTPINTQFKLDRDFLFVRKGKSLIKLKLENIVYIKVEGRYSRIFGLKNKFLVCLSLKKLFHLLPKSIFYQTHRSYIVNVKRINEICLEDNLIVLENNQNAILSERFKPDFINAFFVLK